MWNDEYQPATADEIAARDRLMAEVFGPPAEPDPEDEDEESPTHDLGGEA